MPHAPQHYEDLEVGRCFTAGPRTLTRADIDAFTELSGDRTALHTDDAYAATTPFGGVVAHGALALAVATGLAHETGAFAGTVLAFRGLEARFDRPVLPGDALRLELTVDEIDTRPRPDRGRVHFAMRLVNQHDKAVITGRWSLVMRRRAS